MSVSKLLRGRIIGGRHSVEISVKLPMYAGLDDMRSRRVPTHICGFADVDQLLELHSNLTVVQARLVEILRMELEDALAREREQRVVQRNWNAFTNSLEENLSVLTFNATNLTRDLLGALVRLQMLTRDSATTVADHLALLEGDIRSVRQHIQQVRLDMDAFSAAELSVVETLAEASQERLSMV